jgi:4-hydroxybenzoate polyprenyltransferase
MPNSERSKPICVDLDNTLLRTNTFSEGVLQLFRTNPLYLFAILFWCLTRGTSFCRQKVGNLADLSALSLPVNKELMSWLTQRKQEGRTLILVTSADQKVAHTVAKQCDLFDAVFAGGGKLNLRGKKKRDFLVEQFGEKGFDYVGHCHEDLPTWEAADCAVVVSNNLSLQKAAKSCANVTEVFAKPKLSFKVWRKALRVHQYAKNVLIFAPWVLGHQYYHLGALFNCLLAFISFSLLASSVYVLNDLVDLPDDRQHRSKCYRPFASGSLSIFQGLLLFLACFVVAWGVACQLSVHFQMVLAGYFVLTLLYSLWLKQQLLVDVIVLSTLYTIRLVAGIVVAEALFSEWLLLLSLFLFTSLAFLKRYIELYFARQDNVDSLKGRGYHVSHISTVKMFGIASGYLSILIFALYLHSAKAIAIYHFPMLLYLICPLLIYWISRMWLIAVDGKMDEDPVHFAIKDKATYVVLLISVLIILIASY